MYVEWTKHLKTKEDKSRFTNEVYSAKSVLERLHTLLTEKEQSLDRSEVSINAYSSPNWAYEQAHKNGNREAISYLKKLINLDQQKENNDR